MRLSLVVRGGGDGGCGVMGVRMGRLVTARWRLVPARRRVKKGARVLAVRDVGHSAVTVRAGRVK